MLVRCLVVVKRSSDCHFFIHCTAYEYKNLFSLVDSEMQHIFMQFPQQCSKIFVRDLQILLPKIDIEIQMSLQNPHNITIFKLVRLFFDKQSYFAVKWQHFFLITKKYRGLKASSWINHVQLCIVYSFSWSRWDKKNHRRNNLENPTDWYIL